MSSFFSSGAYGNSHVENVGSRSNNDDITELHNETDTLSVCDESSMKPGKHGSMLSIIGTDEFEPLSGTELESLEPGTMIQTWSKPLHMSNKDFKLQTKENLISSSPQAIPLAQSKSKMSCPRFVGRRAELEMLRIACGHEAQPRPKGIVMISGPIGIGKRGLLLQFFQMYHPNSKPVWLDCFKYVYMATGPMRHKVRFSTVSELIGEQTEEPIILSRIDIEDRLHIKILQTCLRQETHKRTIFILTQELNPNYVPEPKLHVKLCPFTLLEVKEYVSLFPIFEDRDGSSELLVISNGVPLVLNEMVKVIETTFKWDLAKYIKAYREVSSELETRDASKPNDAGVIPTTAEVQRTLYYILPYFDSRYILDPKFLLQVLKFLMKMDNLTSATFKKIHFELFQYNEYKDIVQIDRDAQSKVRIRLMQDISIPGVLKKLVEACLSYDQRSVSSAVSNSWLIHLVSIWNYFSTYKDKGLRVDKIFSLVQEVLTKGQVQFEVSPDGDILVDRDHPMFAKWSWDSLEI